METPVQRLMAIVFGLRLAKDEVLDNVFDWLLSFQKDKFLVLGMTCEICIRIYGESTLTMHIL